jgi:uridine nucleosidase
MNNAARTLHAVCAPHGVKIYPGAPKPLIRVLRHNPGVHGPDGLGGVEGLPSITHPEVAARIQMVDQKPVHAIQGIADAIRDTWKDGEGHHVTLVATGPMTNIALFVSVYPDLIHGIGQCPQKISLIYVYLYHVRQISLCSWAAELVVVVVLHLQVCDKNISK